VGEDREHRFAGRALETPDGDTRKPDTHILRMAGQTPSPTTARLVLQLNANGHDEGHDTGEKRLAVAKHLEVGRFSLKSTVMVRFSRGGLAVLRMGHPQVRWSAPLMTHHGGHPVQFQENREGIRALPRNPGECGFF